MSFKGTVVGLIPENWIIDTMENSLEEIIDYRGKTPEKSDSGIITLSAKSVKNGYIDYGNAYYISDETYKKFMVRGFPEKGDVLLTTEAPLGCVAKLDRDDVGLAQRLLTLRGKARYLDNDYLRYYLMSDIGQHQLKSRESGTTVTGIKQSEFRKAYVVLPPFNEQCGIAATLSCLDDKIELNNRMNKNLEEMAQAIFKSWFVDFEPFQDGEFEESELGMIPKGWRVGTLNEISNIVMGQSPSGISYNEEKVGTVFYQGRTDFGFRFPNIRLYTTEPKRMAKKGDVLLSVRAPVGDLNVAKEDCCIGRGLAALSSINNCNSFLLYTIFNVRPSLNIFNGEGTVFGSINKDALHNIKIIVPDDSSVLRFENVVSAVDKTIQDKEKETRNLIMIRDTLLPKLMSGEIRVPIEEVQ